ncbi:hypothetical protein CGLO_15899 [Colletotrichum gloeosporioides Cg-14]|uniref:Uncharacterized protein n=1 Tax=Colletotrichum gloeosporioides (strain Cg-14) TaxID=1237896 RepID=T0K0K0_COLGC|nr:hypothetical protein CGLO_15899 [Colletotrichum gloeosporioides Cg-14]
MAVRLGSLPPTGSVEAACADDDFYDNAGKSVFD